MEIGFEISHALKYGKHKASRTKAERVIGAASLIEDVVNSCATKLELTLPGKMHVYLRTSKYDLGGAHVTSACMDNATIEVDPRQTITGSIATICHELVHVSQALVGDIKYKLDIMEDRSIKWIAYWEGSPYPDDDSPEFYDNCPWEIDANARGHLMMMQFKRAAYTPYKILKKYKRN